MIGKRFFKHKTAILLTVVLGMGIMQAFCQGTAGTRQKTKDKPVAAVIPGEQKPAATPVVKAEDRQLIVYYFMTTYRCHSCIYIEETARQAVNEAFAPELKSGRIVFRMINVEEKGNEHFNDDYQLFTKSVVLSDLKTGKQEKWKTLDKVWKMIGQDEPFKAYIVNEIKALL